MNRLDPLPDPRRTAVVAVDMHAAAQSAGHGSDDLAAVVTTLGRR